MKNILYIQLFLPLLIFGQEPSWDWLIGIPKTSLYSTGFSDIVTDENGNSYVIGTYNNNQDFYEDQFNVNENQTCNPFCYQSFISKFDFNGNYLWSYDVSDIVTGENGSNPSGISIGNDGFIYRSSSSRLVMKVLDSSYSISPVEGNTVSLSYVLYDLNDSSVVIDRRTIADPFVFTLGVDEVMPGLDEAVRKMHLNETSLILLTSDLAYRESAAVLPNYEGLRQVLVELQVIPNYASAIEPFQIPRFEASIERID